MKRVALFGGTFDPIHLGHTFIASRARERCELDEVIFMPCWHSPHKLDRDPPTDGSLRLRMIELATQDLPWAKVSSWELDRAEASFSWQTAEFYRQNVLESGDQLFWIIGMDQWQAIERWARINYLKTLVEFIVFPRDGQSPEAKDGFATQFLKDAMAVSSTEIRTRRAQGLSITDQVTSAVADYLAEKALYLAS